MDSIHMDIEEIILRQGESLDIVYILEQLAPLGEIKKERLILS